MMMKTKRNFFFACLLISATPVFAQTTPEIAPPVVDQADPNAASVDANAALVNVGIVGVAVWSETEQNASWVDINGMALYNYDKDSGSESMCNDECAATWPPLAAEDGVEGVNEWTVITRQHGTKQWAFRSHPLYTYVNDKAPGEVNGEGVNGFNLAD